MKVSDLCRLDEVLASTSAPLDPFDTEIAGLFSDIRDELGVSDDVDSSRERRTVSAGDEHPAGCGDSWGCGCERCIRVYALAPVDDDDVDAAWGY